MKKFIMTLETTPDANDIQFIGQSLRDFNSIQTGINDAKRLAVFMRDENGEIVGGLIGMTFYCILAIDLLWVREEIRGKGFGSQLLQAAENEAILRGCTQIQLDTFDFQAPDFYKKHGYEVFGVLEGVAGNHKRYYLRKYLTRE